MKKNIEIKQRIADFLLELEILEEKYSLLLAHEDQQGAFVYRDELTGQDHYENGEIRW